ncbi:accessory factor UbiK family protein [Gilvimarinus sp. DA14]|uniref:accessory factor UbiK family protein n=1 Tax=Gilvimarinus sp. DA14 TaxID=2956798 RepID=UPI0020B78A86|nr:accessory factor UbiK family protein [Gilvimarinus sp. DA14]UTF59208.1 accessory factor UbiK family protein [Gilvimarinus sp. DA14]
MQSIAQQLFEELKRQAPNLDELPRPEFNRLLQGALRKLDLVSREEFDAQAAVLARTRARLEALEAKVANWEAQQATDDPKLS